MQKELFCTQQLMDLFWIIQNSRYFATAPGNQKQRLSMTYHPHSVSHSLARSIRTGNEGNDRLVIRRVLGASDVPENHYVNIKVLRKNSVTWQQAKEFIKKCPTCFLYNQTPLHTRSNSKGTNKVNKKMESGR